MSDIGRTSPPADEGDGPIGIPEPPVRPDPRAQWDEVHGCWIVWDRVTERWIPESQPMVIDLRDGTVVPPQVDARRRASAS